MNETPPRWLGSPGLRRLQETGVEVALVLPVGVAAGSASALFLASLEAVTTLRVAQPLWLWALPVLGLAVVWFYHRWGGTSGQGNSLILEEIHRPGGGVPRRLAPLVLVGTLLTHLGGGSAGREGTAIQMGGSLAAGYARALGLKAEHLRLVLMAGVAAGFGSVFGTPVAGAIFAVEVLVAGQLRHQTLVPMLAASVVGHLTCLAWGIQHSLFPVVAPMVGRGWFELALVGQAALVGVAFGLVAQLFIVTEKGIRAGAVRLLPNPYGRVVAGALALIALTYALGTRDYLGLSVHPSGPGHVALETCFGAGGVTTWSWFWKLLFTALTLAVGFRGGEVTPLFFIGAALGNVLGAWLGAPVELFAALGFVAVFGGAARTPLACTVMGIEVFGGAATVYFATACFFAYFFAGERSLYSTQRRAERERAP